MIMGGVSGRSQCGGDATRVPAGIIRHSLRLLCLVVTLAACGPATVGAEPLRQPEASTEVAGTDRATPVGDAARPAGQVDAIVPQRLAQAASQPPAADSAPQSVGIVSSLQGSATVVRNGASAALKVQDEIFKGDVLKTGPGATLGVIFDDETTFSLTANASIAVDDFLYEEGGGQNVARLRFMQGTVAFVAHAVAKTGDMTLSTPTATMGIRGTTGLVNVGASGATSGADAIKLYPDADGKVGRIEVKGRDGTSLGVLTRPATGLSVQRGAGAGARVVATPLQISPQEAARDQNLVRQVHAERQRGQALVAQRRAARPRGAAPGTGPRGAPKSGAPAGRPSPALKPPAAQPPPSPAQKQPGVQPPSAPKPPALRRGPPPRPAMPPRGRPVKQDKRR